MAVFCLSFVVRLYVVFCFLVLVVSTSAINSLARLISEVTCYVSRVMLNTTHLLTHFCVSQMIGWVDCPRNDL